MPIVYLLEHFIIHEDGHEDTKTIGIFSNEEKAIEVVNKLKILPGFRKAPNIINPLVDDEESGFYLSDNKLDEFSWTEGFG